MKKIALILELLLVVRLSNLFVAPIFATTYNPVIIRNPFCESAYDVWLPADDTGQKWSRWKLNWFSDPSIHKEYGNVYTVCDVWYGIPRSNREIPYTQYTAKSGTWLDTVLYGWHYYQEQTGFSNCYLKFNVPANHNEIHFIAMGGEPDVNVSIGTSSGGYTYYTFPSVVFNNNAQEIVVTTTSPDLSNFSPTKEVKIKSDSNGCLKIVGIESYNTYEANVPETNGRFVTIYQINNLRPWVYESNSPSPDVAQVIRHNCLEFEISWKPVTQSTYKWTTANAYEDAPFTPSGTAKLYADGAFVGDMNDINSIPLGTIIKANTLSCRVAGWGDWEKDATRGSYDLLNLLLTHEFASQGLFVQVDANWTGDANSDYGYLPSIPLGTASTNKFNFKMPPAATIYDPNTSISPLGNYAEIRPTNKDYVLYASTTGPWASPLCVQGAQKIYWKAWPLFNNSVVHNGDKWSIGESFSIRTIPPVTNEFLRSDINHDGTVNFVDFALLASHWWETNCDTCGGADLTDDGQVDFLDLRKFAEEWLARTSN